jgi:N-acetylglucosaminyldiphosphoundecaprenol N-acetyl-beta-D-mannosaminyltransferase
MSMINQNKNGASSVGATCQQPGRGVKASHERLNILGVAVSDLTASECLALLDDGLKRDQPLTVFYANAHSVNLTFSVPEFREILNSADILYADGIGLELAARLHGLNVRENLAGTDFLPTLLRWASQNGISLYFLGGTPEVVRRAAHQAVQQNGSLRLHGYHHGFFRDDDVIIEDINIKEPSLLLVGLGSPLQEKWVHDNRLRLKARNVITVGGFFDF